MASREVSAIIAYAESTRLPFRVTSTYRKNPPGRRSYHGAAGIGGDGLAVDFAGGTPGVTPATVAQMTALYGAFRDVAAQLAELIYNGPGVTKAVLNGRLVDGRLAYGEYQWTAHRDHVHVAVPRGVFLTPRPPPAAGSGPPTVTAAAYPGGEDVLIRHDVDIPALDSQGRGWVQLDLPPDRVVAMIVNGPYPPVDGYWTLPTVARQDRGGKTIVSLVDGHPGGHVLLSVWAMG